MAIPLVPGAGLGAGFEYKLLWNQSILELTDHQIHHPPGWRPPGGVLIEDELGMWSGGPNDGLAYHRYWCTALTRPLFTGVMSLCTYTFSVVYTPTEPERYYNGTLDIQDDEFLDNTGTPIAHTTYDGQYLISARGPGDVNNDGIVDMSDVVTVALAFGSMAEDDPNTPWDETRKWKPVADLNQDGVINIIDLVIVGVNFGKTA